MYVVCWLPDSRAFPRGCPPLFATVDNKWTNLLEFALSFPNIESAETRVSTYWKNVVLGKEGIFVMSLDEVIINQIMSA